MLGPGSRVWDGDGRWSRHGRRYQWPGRPMMPRVPAAAPVALALMSVVLFVGSAALQVPLTRSRAQAALIMVASTLVPVGPLDDA
jgi:hypothetical protein